MIERRDIEVEKRFLYYLLGLSLIVNAILIGYSRSGASTERDWHPQDILDVDFNLSEDQLISNGFKGHYSPNVVSKGVGSALVNYTILENKGIFAMSIVGMEIGSDSLAILRWVKSIGGFISSPFFNLENNRKKFYVKSFRSGQIFTGIIKDSTVILNIDFPNMDNLHRSSNRIIRANGEIVVYDSLNDVIVTRNDNIGF